MCNDDSDHDNDLLSNSLELAIGTDPCLADTDNDQMSDGWEYYVGQGPEHQGRAVPRQAAVPERARPLGRRAAGARSSPYDFDGDGLTTLEEYRAWRYTGSSFDASKAGGTDLESPLGYSDGTKFSRLERDAERAALARPQLRPAAPAQPSRARTTSTATARGATTSATPTPTGSPTGSSPRAVPASRRLVDRLLGSTSGIDGGAVGQRSRPRLRPGVRLLRPSVRSRSSTWPTPTSTATRLLDGEDDQDNDDFSNITELYEVGYDLDGDGRRSDRAALMHLPASIDPSIDSRRGSGRINPFNPCAPDPNSRTCQDYMPF